MACECENDKDKECCKNKRVFKCASCSHVFEQEGRALRCPECWGKTLILLEGPSLRGGKNCSGHCSSCGCGCH